MVESYIRSQTWSQIMNKWHLLLGLPLVACAGDTAEEEEPTPAVEQFGFEDERSFTLVADSAEDLDVPRDLGFNPSSPDQLWIVNQATDSTTIIFDAGTEEQDWENRVDVFANHFMEEVSSLSFGENNAFATCQESMNTYNGTSAPNGFMGPALWPGDLDVYAVANQNPWGSMLGSHLDMLHQSPLCMGAEWISGNAYWIFDGKNENLVMYDFQEDHGPGGDDHSDGIVRRHSDVELLRLADVPSHMALNHETAELFIANTGAGEVLWVDSSSGEENRNLSQNLEPLEEYTEWVDTDHEVFADDFEDPSGVWLHNDVLFVSDHATGEIVALDMNGDELERIDTGAESIMGITVGPEGKLWYVDAGANELVRIDP
jgi:hypothetical protein